jgi:serine/threonine protein kinase
MGDAQRRQDIFTQALATPPGERSVFLDSVCGEDAELRKDIERQLSTSLGSSATPQTPGKSPSAPQAKTIKIPPRLKQALKNTYVIQERIGGGGMGEIYLATHKTLGGKWAIKVLADEFAKKPIVVERFVNEAKIEANLQHPNVVKVFHIGHSGGFHYLVMSYVDGEDLTERIAKGGALPESEVVSIALQICKALECAHDHNITHRDLKPSNVRIDNYGTVIVLDFGIARARDVAMGSLTSQGERLGTPLYMSPEQIRGAGADARSDLYSLGVLMYEMLGGHNPFDADLAHAVYARQLNYTPPALVDIRPSVSPILSGIVMRLLEKDAEKRFQTAREVGARLRPLREKTEITGATQMSAATSVESAEVRDRLNHVVRKVAETQISRPLSAEETRVLELADGQRTVAQILALSELEPEHLFNTLDGLKNEKAIETIVKPAAEGDHPAWRDYLEHALSFIPLKYRWYALWALAVLVVIAGAFPFYSTLTAVPPILTQIRFDASPYASVSIKDRRGKEVYKKGETPFLVSLEAGPYSIEFTHDRETKTQKLMVETGKSVQVRENFWQKADIDQLLSILK